MSHVDDGALHAYLDGELSPVERERLEAHLADCPACRARLDEERALVERASQLLGLALPPERAAPPPPLHQLRQPRVLWRLRMPLAWAASLVLAVGFGYYFAAATFRAGRQIPSADDSTYTLSGARATDSSTPAASIATAERSRQATPRAPKALRAERQERERRAAARDEVADQGGVTKARADSVALAPAIVALEPKVELRGATAAAPAAPAPLPQAVVVTGAAREAESRLAVLRGRLMTTQWPIIRRGSARELLGADPVGVPGLAVREMRRSPAGDGVVLVEQEVDSTTVIQLFQRRAEPEQAAGEALTRQRRAEGYVETERLARFIGSLRVEIAGPLTTDSLNRLLEKVKPIQ